MRLFAAVDLDEAARAAADAEARRLAERLAHTAGGAALRWVPAANLHVTLRFLGHLQAAAADSIVHAWGAPLAASACRVALAGAGTFPAAGPPHVLWLGVRAERGALHDVYRAVQDRLLALGHETDPRGLSAHVTIARVRRMGAREAGRLREALRAVPPAGVAWTVTHVTLYESRPGPGGAEYIARAHAPLRAADAGLTHD